MSLGENLYRSRKKKQLSQEKVAEKINVSRQTISKWELNETIPDIYQVQALAFLYQIDMQELISVNPKMIDIEDVIKNTNDNNVLKTDWTSAWSQKYPVLKRYQNEISISYYQIKIKELLSSLEMNYHYSKQDAMLVLKDILYHTWKEENKKKNSNQIN